VPLVYSPITNCSGDRTTKRTIYGMLQRPHGHVCWLSLILRSHFFFSSATFRNLISHTRNGTYISCIHIYLCLLYSMCLIEYSWTFVFVRGLVMYHHTTNTQMILYSYLSTAVTLLFSFIHKLWARNASLHSSMEMACKGSDPKITSLNWKG